MPGEELVEVLLRLLLRHVEPARQPEGGDAVDDREVRGLRDVALLGRHVVERDAEHLGRRAPVDVLAPPEGLDQALLARDVGEDAQLDLGVVGGEEAVPRLRHERRADAPAELGADRDVLRVRVARRQPPRHRDELVERRVNAARPRVDQRRQRVGIRRLELGECPVLDDLGGQLVAEGELLQHVGVGRVAGLGLPERRQLELLEEDGGELLGRADIELARPRARRCPGSPARAPARARARTRRGAACRRGCRRAPCGRGRERAAARCPRRARGARLL